MALRYGGLDSAISLMLAFFVNAAILILAAAAFYYGPKKLLGTWFQVWF
jgi:Mn2+/Fe2+ NRAMP family transporter